VSCRGVPAKVPLPAILEPGDKTISYRTRDLGYGVEEGIAEAYVTADVDPWGKRTIFVKVGEDTWQRWYLFSDEWYEV